MRALFPSCIFFPVCAVRKKDDYPFVALLVIVIQQLCRITHPRRNIGAVAFHAQSLESYAAQISGAGANLFNLRLVSQLNPLWTDRIKASVRSRRTQPRRCARLGCLPPVVSVAASQAQHARLRAASEGSGLRRHSPTSPLSRYRQPRLPCPHRSCSVE